MPPIGPTETPMPKTITPPARPMNWLLARLPDGEFRRLSPRLQPVVLPHGQTLHRARAGIDHVYFPTRGVASALTVMEDGRSIEVANIGNEGVVGLAALFGAGDSPNEVIVQVPGEGLRMRGDVFRAEGALDGPFRSVLLRYQGAWLTQASYSVACNGLHTVRQRCARWLLMTHDRVGGDELRLTHEFLGIMLGVRRASVTEVLRPLSEAGLVRAGRGRMTVLDRRGLLAESCECYRAVRAEYERLLG